MSAASDYLENKILDHILGGGVFTRPPTLYLALYTAGPTDSGGGTEVSGSAYSRVAVTNNSTNFPAASGGSKSNGAPINFPTATGNWGTVTHFGVFDAASDGNLLFHGALNASKVIENGDTPSYPVSSMTFTAN
jgi:hypothetical protein